MAEEETQLVKKERELVQPGFAFLPKTYTELLGFAKEICNTDFVPKSMRGSPGAVLAAWQTGSEIGLPPMAALQSIAIINGRPSVHSDGYWALIVSHSLCEWFTETPPDAALKQGFGECTIKRRGNPHPITRRFSMEEANTAGLVGKDNWKNYPGDMLQNRARHRAGSDAIPEATQGILPSDVARDLPPIEIEIEKQPPIAIPSPKQSGTVADFKARQAEKAKPDIGGDLSDKVDPKHRELADAMDRLRQEQVAKGKTDGERREPVVDKAVSAKAGDGVREGSDRTARENAPGTAARQEAQANSQSEPEKKPAAEKAGGEPEKKPKNLKAEIMAWISVATLEDLNSQDHEKCFIRKVFATKTLLAELTPDERAEVLTAYDKERRSKP